MVDGARGSRETREQERWTDAYAELRDADRRSPLDPDDLERLATAGYITGHDLDSDDAWVRAHRAFLASGDVDRAARCGFWLALLLMLRGEMARANGWLTRIERLLDERRADCAVKGYLLIPRALALLECGEPGPAHDAFEAAAAIGERFGDPDLVALGTTGRGQARIRAGRTAAGVAFLDEAMVAVTAGEVSRIVSGIVYCAVVDACREMFDLRRAQEWTSALSRWCASQHGMVAYRGQCHVHRAEIMQLHGEWPDAEGEARLACELLAGRPAAGEAFYRLGEIHRLRGAFDEAEDAYRWASRSGLAPDPGLAQLRLAQGRTGAAATAIRRAMDGSRDDLDRARLLPAFVEIMLAAGDVPSARAGSDDLSRIAGDVGAAVLRAAADHASGAVLLAEGDPRSACGPLRNASTAWQQLEAPYEAARTRTWIGLACRELGDEDNATLEMDAARETFERLGASPDLARLDGRPPPSRRGGLSVREVEVLRLVATGMTNRAIASELVISEKTVARHMSNIFTKLGISSRSAATAYAYEHGLA